MNEFWNTHAADAGGPLTREVLEEAVRAMREQQDAYHREAPIVIYPPRLAKPQGGLT